MGSPVVLRATANRSRSTAMKVVESETEPTKVRGKFMAQDRWPTRLGPIVGGLALLMFTGTGDENTDIGAHFMGFLCGFAAGMLLTLIGRMPAPPRVQALSGAAAVGLLSLAWFAALSV